VDNLLKGGYRPEKLPGDGGLMKEFKNALMQRMLGAELTEHLGYEQGDTSAILQTNRCNGGLSRKTVKGEEGALDVEFPRDRDGSCEPRLIGKGQTRVDGLDEKIIALYARSTASSTPRTP